MVYRTIQKRPTAPSSSGGVVLPLSTVRYVDGTTLVPLADRNGSIATPFASLQDGLDALPQFGVLCVAPGDYSGQPALIPPVDCLIQGFIPQWSLGAAFDLTWLVNPGLLTILPNINSPFDLALQCVTSDQVIANRLSLLNSNISTLVSTTSGPLAAKDSLLPSTIAVLGGGITCADCQLGFGGAVAISSDDVNVRLNSCRFGAVSVTMTFGGAPGVLELDSNSAHYWLNVATPAIVNGTRALISDMTP